MFIEPSWMPFKCVLMSYLLFGCISYHPRENNVSCGKYEIFISFTFVEAQSSQGYFSSLLSFFN